MDYEEIEILEKKIASKDLLIEILLERIKDEPHYSQVEYNKMTNKLELFEEKYNVLYSKYLYTASELEKVRKEE